MLPTIHQFMQALRSPADSFTTLQRAEVVCGSDGLPILRRTTRYVEAEITLDGARYLLSMPLSTAAAAQCERTLTALQRLNHPALAAVRWLPGEGRFFTPEGVVRTVNLVLQALPGAALEEAVFRLSSQELEEAIKQLKRDLEALNLAHNNLKAENLRWANGCLVPIRYFDATLGGASERDHHALEAIYTELAGDDEHFVSDCDLPYDPIPKLIGHKWVGHEFEGLICVEDTEGFGYVDAANRYIITPRFSWADDFHEGRAVVQTEQGMGLIDREGRFVLPPIYEVVEYHAAETLIQARQGGLWARFDYMGRQLTPFGTTYEV